jgi:hypothetical protein
MMPENRATIFCFGFVFWFRVLVSCFGFVFWFRVLVFVFWSGLVIEVHQRLESLVLLFR